MRLLFVFVFLLGLVSCGDNKYSSSKNMSEKDKNKANKDKIIGKWIFVGENIDLNYSDYEWSEKEYKDLLEKKINFRKGSSLEFFKNGKFLWKTIRNWGEINKVYRTGNYSLSNNNKLTFKGNYHLWKSEEKDSLDEKYSSPWQILILTDSILMIRETVKPGSDESHCEEISYKKIK
tara:strand:+ start:299 stop:829 length:531 start_codon:yes stop_codon:yes gene_type:complete